MWCQSKTENMPFAKICLDGMCANVNISTVGSCACYLVIPFMSPTICFLHAIPSSTWITLTKVFFLIAYLLKGGVEWNKKKMWAKWDGERAREREGGGENMVIQKNNFLCNASFRKRLRKYMFSLRYFSAYFYEPLYYKKNTK